MNFEKDIQKSIETLKNGGILLYPTDTIWGLGCDAENEKAISRIYEIKKRVFSKSMIILAENTETINKIIAEFPQKAVEIISQTENPLTIIYQNAKNLAKNVIAEDGTIAVRIPNDDFCQKLLKEYGKPVVSTSANISGENPPSNFEEISEEIKENCDYIVKWRQDDYTKAQPSTIIKIEQNGEITVIRK
ncbi:MAG: threonylcarbamoyl-AMP synthase [Bacteroidales bacterium]|nr:threonylcarbamoyl-AMP synthase [Bacteroidales bacterium]